MQQRLVGLWLNSQRSVKLRRRLPCYGVDLQHFEISRCHRWSAITIFHPTRACTVRSTQASQARCSQPLQDGCWDKPTLEMLGRPAWYVRILYHCTCTTVSCVGVIRPMLHILIWKLLLEALPALLALNGRYTEYVLSCSLICSQFIFCLPAGGRGHESGAEDEMPRTVRPSVISSFEGAFIEGRIL